MPIVSSRPDSERPFSVRSSLVVAAGLLAALVVANPGAWGQQGARVPLPRLLAQTHVHGLAMDATDPSRLLIATHQGFYATEDGLSAHIVSNHRDDLMGFTPHPTDAAILYASGHPAQGGNLGIVVSHDGGQTWNRIAPGADGPVDFHQMDISRADPRVLYGVYGTLQVSRDSGRSWRAVGERLNKVIDLAASAVNTDTVYLATAGGLRISRDAGRNWSSAGLDGATATLVHATGSGELYAFVVGRGLLRADERSLAWESLSNDFGSRALLHLAVHADRPERLFAASQHSELFTSSDGGRTWAVLALPAR